MIGIKQGFMISAYHPDSNGAIEQFNLRFDVMLAKYATADATNL